MSTRIARVATSNALPRTRQLRPFYGRAVADDVEAQIAFATEAVDHFGLLLGDLEARHRRRDAAVQRLHQMAADESVLRKTAAV
jgi:hypothetical protein